MYVTVSGKGKAKVIQYREDTRIPGTNKRKAHVVETLGNYERMLAEDPNIIEKLKEKARAVTEEKKAEKAQLSITVSSEILSSPEICVPTYHFGQAIIQKLWEIMGLRDFFIENCGKKNAEGINQAICYLTARRCSNPDSIRACSMGQDNYAGISHLGIDIFYDVLDVLADNKDAFIKHLSAFFEKKTSRKGPEAFYDVTTISFESTRWGELRMFGFSKDHKNNEIQVVMGLLIDNHGIPITYELFPGNTMDQRTLMTSVKRLKDLYRLEKITIVADRGLNSGKNLEFICSEGNDFVISYTLKKSPEDFKALVFDDGGWESEVNDDGAILYKSKVIQKELLVKIPVTKNEREEETKTGKKRGRPCKYEQKLIPVNIHLTYSAKRAKKDREDRERLLTRLAKRLDKPYQMKASIRRGCNQYLQMDLDTENWSIDEQKIHEAEKYDGFYAIITNNMSLSTEQASTIYGGLWKIEESFRIMKTDLKARPVFVWTDKHIQGHFVMCFLALCLLRYLQFLIETQTATSLSAELIMEGIASPLALVQGPFPRNVITPTRVTDTYLMMANLLKLPQLRTNMTLTQFRAATKLDLSINLNKCTS